MVDILELYDVFKEDISSRYFPPKTVEKLIEIHQYKHEVIGKSFEDRNLYKLTFGQGNIKLLFWAQMHGNETTAARAMFDLWKFLHLPEFSKHYAKVFEIHFIPQLNPDGAQYYSRRNSAQIDINRDFNAEQSSEIQILKNLIQREKFDFLFNLHDQRSIFHPENKKYPATLSFLAPVIDVENSYSNAREKAINLISCMINRLNVILPNQIARFSHEFYPKATGDNLQKAGWPTILIESGHYNNDYQRNSSRKFTFYAILSALNALIEKENENIDANIYHQTPINDNKAFDIIYKDVCLQRTSSQCITDIGIQFEEKLISNEIHFEARIAEIGDLSDYFGHDIYHAENRVFQNELNNLPKIGMLANFKIGNLIIKNGKPQE
ncbi:MAG: M14 family zinc carboxypeptidase [Flavobacteriaceae bacterium]|nr:M14 family zinc carboxypeptidase [Flavobacteriaceae bacterium]